LRSPITACLLVAASLLAGFAWHYSTSSLPPEPARPIIDKQPGSFSQRSFDPANPPSDMPPLGQGEEAECDSNFISDASVSGHMQKIDSTNATVTVAQVKITLQLKITIWVPNGATLHVVEHEEGHRQISEHYYDSANKLAAEVAAPYIGRQIAISGSDLNAEFRNALLQLGKDITAEYNSKLNPDLAQQRYDDLTDHSRNDRNSKEAAAQALHETQM
jgi:hypothetical protein